MIQFGGETRFAPYRQAAENWGNLLKPSYQNQSISIDIQTISGLTSPASARPIDIFRGGPPFRDNTFYPIALGNQLSGYDHIPGESDILINVNSNINSLEREYSDEEYNFLVGIGMHEIGHGLGFYSHVIAPEFAENFQWTEGFLPEGNNPGIGFDGPNPFAFAQLPGIFDRFLSDSSVDGVLLADMDAVSRANAITSEVFWTGPEGIDANDGNRPQLFTPNEYFGGNSVLHCDPDIHPEALMNAGGTTVANPFLGITELDIAILRDIGWDINTANVPLPPSIWFFLGLIP